MYRRPSGLVSTIFIVNPGRSRTTPHFFVGSDKRPRRGFGSWAKHVNTTMQTAAIRQNWRPITLTMASSLAWPPVTGRAAYQSPKQFPDQRYANRHLNGMLPRRGSDVLPHSLWNQPVSDSFRPRTRTVLERREHSSAMTMVKGKRWFAKLLLEFQAFPSHRSASVALIERSRQLIAETRSRITTTTNTLVCSRRRRYVN